MRYSRLLALLGLVGVIALALALVIHHSPAASQPMRAAARAPESARRTLRQELQQFLVTHRPGSRLARPIVGGQTCFVGPGTCSLNPCVIPVQRSVPAPVPASSAAVSAVPTSSAVVTGARVSSVVVTVAAPHTLPALPVPGSSCRRAQNTPRVLRVAGP